MTRRILLLAGLLGFAGCMTHESANVYDRHEAGREQTVRMATVEEVRKVQIAGSQSGVGAAAGGAVGGIAGTGVGEGRGSSAAAVLGAVAGGVAGNMLENRATTKDAYEITVRLDSDELRAIVQETDVAFSRGQRVRLLNSGGVTRVTP